MKVATVAIIGGGLAGLAAGCRLRLEGIDVRLYEANAKPGGCCATTRVGGYVFNDGALFLALPGLLDHLFRRLDLDRQALLPLRRVSHVQRTTLPDGTIVDFDVDRGISIEDSRDARASAKARDELERFLRKWDPLLRILSDDLLVHPLSLARFAARAWRQVPLLCTKAASQLTHSFSHEAVRAALSGALLYNGVAPSKAPAPSLVALASLFREGYFIPESGMGRIPEALADALRQRGGEIHLASCVRRIRVREGRVVGIEMENADLVEADAVISTVSALQTVESLLARSDTPRAMARKAHRAVLSHKGFVVQLGLANTIAAPSYSNYVLPWLREQQEVLLPDSRALRWPLYMVPTTAVPGLAPPGGSIVEIFPPVDQHLRAEDWTEERKEIVAAQAIERLRGLHRLDVATIRIRSPKEFQEETRLHSGALYGLSPAAGPAALFDHRTPIPNLYQAGQTTWPGFGVACAALSGVMAAEALMRDAA